MIFNKGANSVQLRKDSSRNGATTGHSYVKKKNLDTDLTPFTKINSTLIIAQNVKWKAIKLLEDNIGENLGDLMFGDEVLDTTPKA